MTPPPLAVWLMASFRAEVLRAGLGSVGSMPWCPEWVAREVEDDALLSLHGVRERSADVWVEWPGEFSSEPPRAALAIVVSEATSGPEGGVRPWTGTPAELVRWLRGES